LVDNRSAGFFGIGGAFNFKSGDISGTAAKNQDDKMGPGTEYGEIPDKEEEESQNNAPYVQTFGNMDGTSAGIIFHQAISVIAASNS